MSKASKKAITPTREQDFPEWYQQVLKAADLAENSPVRGCMIIKPWGYGIWELMQRQLDDRIKAAGSVNAYFPLFIPLSFLEQEAAHVDGFAKECAVVTHHRLEEHDGKLIPSGELEEPLIVRPTSETIIGHSFARWIESYRDLPLKINQWANVVRWEMRTRIFLRTSEFLWQEGHTAHASAEEAMATTREMLEVYRRFMEDVLAIPVITGVKSPAERFPGAVETFTTEAMMQDRKALQFGTSHYLGQNFAKAQSIQFSDADGALKNAYTTSWGVTTRLIGGMIMTHGDDDGLQLPPRVAPQQVMILPIAPKPEHTEKIHAFCANLKTTLQEGHFHGLPLRVQVDDRDRRGGEKNWEWIKKGIPLRIEVGPRDLENNCVMVCRRDRGHQEKVSVPVDELESYVLQALQEIQEGLFQRACAYRDRQICDDVEDLEALKAYFTPENPDKPEVHGGFVRAKWCEDPETEKLLEGLKVTIRCLPLEQRETEGRCLFTGKPATTDIILAKSY